MTQTMGATPPEWAHNPPKPGFEPTQPYVTQGGDSLPSIAELYGHSGEWQAILEVNPSGWVAEHWNSLVPGLEVTVPAEWMGTSTRPAAEPEHQAHRRSERLPE